MRTPRGAALRLLSAMMIGSLVLPAVLFIYAAWLNYNKIQGLADERINRSLDVLSEHTLKVLNTPELVIDEIAESIDGLSDEDVRSNEARLHTRFKRMADTLPQVSSIWLTDRDGYALISSYFFPAPRGGTLIDQDVVRAQVDEDHGIYIGAVEMPRWVKGPAFFGVSRRRPTADGAFNGVINVSLLPDDFEKFYAGIGSEPGTYFAMIQADGSILARHPAPANLEDRLNTRARALAVAVLTDGERGIYTARAQLDGIERNFGYRKVERYPIYVVAGLASTAIRQEWLSTMGSHLIFGLPATLLLFLILGVALRRTKSLYAEEDRRAAAETALRKSQQLEAIGQLTGGVAHDFNNLLMVIAGNVDRLKRKPHDEKDSRILDMIATAAKRGETLTRQLLSFSRRQALSPEPIDVSKRIPELKEILARSLREDIEVAIEMPDHLCSVKVDPGELELAVLNIGVNARDAMPNGGRLAIAARRVTLQGEPATDGLAGDFVEIEFADTGSGIPPEVLPRVFEPFFTTKGERRGTGLGLSQAYGFAKQSGGTVTVTSALGQGTTIRMYLPCAEAENRPVASDQEEPAAAGGRKTVLVVEDDLPVAEVCKCYLDQLGYDVEFASCPRDALQALRQGENPVDAMLSDILMPGGMSGLDLAHQVRRIRPALPIVLMTGFSDCADQVVRDGFPVIRKPFDLVTMQAALNAACDRPRCVERYVSSAMVER